MNAHQLERAAYLAAHRILMTDTAAPELACPGARRSHAIDVIAGVIKDIFELHLAELREGRQCASSIDGRAETKFEVPERYRTGVVFEIPHRA